MEDELIVLETGPDDLINDSAYSIASMELQTTQSVDEQVDEAIETAFNELPKHASTPVRIVV